MNLRNEIAKYTPYNEQEEKDKEVMLKYVDAFDDVMERKNEFAHFSASAWIVNKEQTKVLMAFHNIYQSWSWIGGHADGDSDLLHVALKETEEETGLKEIQPLSDEIFSIEILSVDGHVKKENHVSTHVHLNLTYLIAADENETTRVNPDENSGIKWMGLDEAIDACTEPYMKIIYKKLNEKLKVFQNITS